MLIREAAFEKSYDAALVDTPSFGCADYEFHGLHREGSRITLLVTLADGRSWTGTFGNEPSWRGLTGTFPTPDSDSLCVINHGRAFLVNTLHPADAQTIPSDGPIRSLASIPSPPLLLLATQWSVVAIGPSGEAWASDRIATEGIRLDDVVGSFAIGVADPDDEEPREFALDLRTGAIAGGTFQSQ